MALDVQISFSWTNYCRLCLMDNGIMLPLFEGEGHIRQLSHKIETCLQLVTYDGDPLPRKICHTCLHKMNQMFDFRSMVWASYERLKLKLLPLQHVPEVQKYLLKADCLQKTLDNSSVMVAQCSTPIPSTSKENATDRLPLIRVKSEEELMQAPDCSSWPSSTPFPHLDSTVPEPFLSSTSSFISSSISSDSNIHATESALPPDNQSNFDGIQPDTLKRKRLSHTSDTSCDRVVSPVVKKIKGKRRQLAGPLSRKLHLNSQWKCVFCEIHFYTKQSLNVHLERCLRCSTCQQEFTSVSEKAIHEAEKHVTVYIDCNQKHLIKRCSRCPARFASAVMLSMHVRDEHSSASIENPVDYADGKLRSLLESGNTSHVSQSSSEISSYSKLDYTSDSEDHPLSLLKDLKKQSNAEMIEEPLIPFDDHTCKFCNDTFTSALDFQEHLKIIHGRFKCSLCDESYVSKNGLSAHQKFHIFKSKKRGKKLQDKETILKDLASSKKPFQCDFCFEEFEEEDAFILHLYVHATEHSDDESIPVKKNRRCAMASKKSVTASSNEESDNAVEQFSVKCERCHVVCRSKEYYKVHLATHMSKAKTNFPCSGCNQNFRNVEALNRHTCCGKLENMQICCLDCGQALVEGADHVCDNKCPVCEKVFKSARGQRLHFVSKHKPKLLVEDGCYDLQSSTQEANSVNDANQEESDNFQEHNEPPTSPSMNEFSAAKSSGNESPVAHFSGNESSAPRFSGNESPDSQSSSIVSQGSRPCGSETPTTQVSEDEFSHVSGSEADSLMGDSPLMERLPPDGASASVDSMSHKSEHNAIPFIKDPVRPSSYTSGILSNL